MTPTFRPFSWWALLRGTPVYEFAEFYEAKDALLRYDGRRGYLNYGLWDDDDTPNPSARLVERMLEQLALGPGDELIDVGSGLGQPDADAARLTPVARVVGVNRNPVQVHLANERFRELGVHHRVHHRVHDAHHLESLDAGRFSAALSVEAMAEMPDLDRVLAGLAAVLCPGARVVICDVVREPSVGRANRAISSVITGVTRLLYGDRWRTIDELRAAFDRAGFDASEVERVGERVYPPTWRWARDHLADLSGSTARAAGFFAWANLRGLDWLFRRGQVEYAILTFRRRG